MPLPKRRKRRTRKGRIVIPLEPKEEMSSVFSSTLDWLQRPERFSTSLLMGEPGKAFQQAGSFLTLGAIDPPKEKYSFSDVVRKYFTNIEKGSTTETVANFLGGLAIDPTTYLTLGVGGFAKKVVVGASKELATRSLGGALLRGIGGKLSSKTIALERKIRSQFPSIKPDKLQAAMGEEAFKDTLFNSKYYSNLTPNDQQRIRGLLQADDWKNLSGDAWDAVIEGMWKNKDLVKSGFRFHAGLPFMKGMEVSGSREFFQQTGKLWDNSIGKIVPLGEYYDLLSKGLVSRLLNRTETTRMGIPEGMKYVARGYVQSHKRIGTHIAEKIWGRFGPEGTDTWYRVVDPNDLTFLKLAPDDLEGYRKLMNSVPANVGETIIRDMKAQNIRGGFTAWANFSNITDPLVWQRQAAAYKKYLALKKSKVHNLPARPLEETMTLPEIIFHRKVARNKGRWIRRLQDYAQGRIQIGGQRAGGYTEKTRAEIEEMVKYAADVFKDFPVNKTFIGKLIGGGKFGPFVLKDKSIVGTPTKFRKGKGIESLLQRLLPGSKWTHTHKGSYLQFPGYNPLWKQLVTTFPTNPSFHLRNAIGSIFMGALDPDIGWSGITAALRMIPGGLTKDSHSFRAVHRALHMDQKIAAAGHREIMALSKKGVKLGGRDIREFTNIAKGALGGRISHSAADITSEIGEAFDLLDRFGTKKFALKYYFNMGENMANYVENYMRLNGLHKLLKANVPEVDAIFRMQKQFVDYSITSGLDRTLRDWIPFIKYQTSSVRWAKQLASRPRQIAWIGKLQESQGVLQEAQKDPRSGETGLFVPLGKYRMALGSGAEATLGMMGSILAPRDFAKEMITSTHPIYRLAIEGAVGRDIYTDQPFMTDRRAPSWMPDKLINLITRKGKEPKAREISPYLRALLYKGPISRQIRTLEQLLGGGDYGESRTAGVLRAFTMTRTVEDFRARESRVLIRRLNHILKEKEREGDLRRYVAWISTYDKRNTPPEIKALLSEYKERIRLHKRHRRKGRN